MDAGGSLKPRPSIRKRTTGCSTCGKFGCSCDDSSNNLVGKVVDIPAAHFGVEVPEMYYRATILGQEKRRKGAVTVQFHEDGSRYWLPARDVKKWLKLTEQRKGGCTSSVTDAFAACVLLDILQQARQSK